CRQSRSVGSNSGCNWKLPALLYPTTKAALAASRLSVSIRCRGLDWDLRIGAFVRQEQAWVRKVRKASKMFGCVRRILFALSDWDGMLARCRNPLRKRPRTLELDLILKPSSSGLRTFRQHLSSTATTGCRV